MQSWLSRPSCTDVPRWTCCGSPARCVGCTDARLRHRPTLRAPPVTTGRRACCLPGSLMTRRTPAVPRGRRAFCPGASLMPRPPPLPPPPAPPPPPPPPRPPGAAARAPALGGPPRHWIQLVEFRPESRWAQLLPTADAADVL